jgi:hypothetical protein
MRGHDCPENDRYRDVLGEPEICILYVDNRHLRLAGFLRGSFDRRPLGLQEELDFGG